MGILLCYLLKKDGKMPFLVSGSITPGLPPFRPPPFHTEDAATGDVINFGDMVSNVGSALVSIPLLSILESIAVAKAFCKFTANHYIFLVGSLAIFSTFS